MPSTKGALREMQARPFLLFTTAAGSLSVLEVGLVRDELPATITTAPPQIAPPHMVAVFFFSVLQHYHPAKAFSNPFLQRWLSAVAAA